MKHPNDPGTAEMFDTPKRRGRPPKYEGGAMSQAERARYYRHRKKSGVFDILDAMDEASLSDICELLKVAEREGAPAIAYCCALEISRRFPEPKGKK